MSSKKRTPDLASEVLGDLGTSQGHQRRISRYASLKRRQQEVSDYILTSEPDLGKLVKKLDDCGSWLLFRHWYLDDIHRLIAGFTCKLWLLCPACAMRRAARYVMEYTPKILQLMEENPGSVLLLITRTIKNGPDLGERFFHLTSSHKRMLQRRRNAGRSWIRNPSVMRFIMGSVGSYEFKKGKGSGEWHPHSHEIALLSPDAGFEFVELVRKGKTVRVPLEFENRLRTEWLEVTGDSHMVDVRMVDASDSQELFKAACEAFKYALKMNELTPEDQIEAYRVLVGHRLVFSYGNFRGVEVSDSLADDIDEYLKDRPYEDKFYRWDGRGEYVRKEMSDDMARTVGEYFSPEKKRKRRAARRAARHDALELNGKRIDAQFVRDWLKNRVLTDDDDDVPF